MKNHLHNFPPILCRLLARKRYGPPLSVEEISSRSQLPVFRTENISNMLDWEHVTVMEMERFTRACGVDLFNPKEVRRVKDYLASRPTFRYLRCSPHWSTYYSPLLALWAVHCQPTDPALLTLAKRIRSLSLPRFYSSTDTATIYCPGCSSSD